jgi:NAD(P)-dependent dehydrogenase (short-subunit alcohol dehydrogenase family)
MSNLLKGKTAIVLGASAKGGSGWTIAEHLVAAGARVAVAARGMDGLNDLASQIEVSPYRCDVGVEDDVRELLAAVSTEFGAIDILIQAAGFPVAGSILETTGEELRTATSVNYFSFVYLLKHGVPAMADGGSVLVLTSLSASRVSPGYAVYGAAKAATENLVRYAAIEFAPRGIRVNAISPGLIETPMAAGVLANPELRRAMYKEIPLGRGVQPDQIALEALNLVRPRSAVTGQTVVVDNGLSLRRSPFPDEIPASAYQESAKQAGY